MVTEKTVSRLDMQLVCEEQPRRVVSTRDRTGILGISPKLLLMLEYSFFMFSLMKRVITAGTLIVKEELLWFFSKS